MNNIWKDLGLEVGKIIADEIKGGPTSGNYGHDGRPGERGGSGAGGGHARIGIEKGASREDARAAVDKHRESRMTKAESARIASTLKKLRDEKYKKIGLYRKSYNDSQERGRLLTKEKIELRRERNETEDQNKKDAITERMENIENKRLNEYELQENLRNAISSAENEYRQQALAMVAVNNPSNTKLRNLFDRGDERIKTANESVTVFNSLVSEDVIKNDFVMFSPEEIEPNDGRSYYENGIGVFITPYSDVKTGVHELGHFLEYSNPDIKKQAGDFLDRRSKGKEPISLKKLTGGSYKDREMAKLGDFISPYVGRIYNDGSTEVVSMGLQYMYEDPGEFAAKDPDHFQFIYNAMRGVK